MPKPASTGITISAAIVLAGSALTTIAGLGFILVAVLAPRFAADARVTPAVSLFIFFDALLFIGFGVWGIFSAIGLFERKDWARISTIVFAAILAFISVPSALLMAVVPLSDPNDRDLPANFFLVFRLIVVVFEAAQAALAMFWLVFFNRRSVKAHFTRPIAATFAPQTLGSAIPTTYSSSPPESTLPAFPPGPPPRVRPLSITVVSWILLAGAALMPLSLVLNQAALPKLQSPIPVLGFLLFGRPAIAFLVGSSVLTAVAAVAMLKLKPWGLYGTITLQFFHLLNLLLVLVIPTLRLRYQQAFEASMSAIHPNRDHHPTFPTIWIGPVLGIGIVAVYLFFLFRDRGAFLSSSRQLSANRL